MWKEVKRERLRQLENYLEAAMYKCDTDKGCIYEVWYEVTGDEDYLDVLLDIFFSEQEAEKYFQRIVECVGISV